MATKSWSITIQRRCVTISRGHLTGRFNASQSTLIGPGRFYQTFPLTSPRIPPCVETLVYKCYMAFSLYILLYIKQRSLVPLACFLYVIAVLVIERVSDVCVLQNKYRGYIHFCLLTFSTTFGKNKKK